jgi:hypothetical protein
LVNEADLAQARTVYYGLEHSAARTQLHVERDERGEAVGFVAACITGMNPFQPVVVLHAPDDGVANGLLDGGLAAGPPYLFMVDARWSPLLEARLGSTAHFSRIFVLEPGRLQPVVNVFVRTSTGPDGAPRATIQAQGRTVAQAGVNWLGSRYAELYVTLEPGARGREWGRSVLSAVAQALQKKGVRPLLYVPQAAGSDAQELADAAAKLGFTDSGRMAMQIAGVLTPPDSGSAT